MNTGAKVGLGIATLGLLYAFTRKKFDIAITRTYTAGNGSKGIDFKACVYSECLSGTYVADWVPKIVPFEQNAGYFLVLRGIPIFNQIQVGIGRKDASGAITADYIRVVDFNTSPSIAGSRKFSYERVVPRDFFNEGKLLKCMGRLALSILDCNVPDGLNIDIEENGEPFDIDLNDSGELYVSNYPVTVNGADAFFFTSYNSKRAYPFYCRINDTDYEVFTDEGLWHPDMIALAKELQ